MDALVMCGGAGTRLDAPEEKPLFAVAGAPMVDHVIDALAESSAVDRVHAAVSPATPETHGHLTARAGVAVIETPGNGYVADLDAALDVVGRPALTVAADLPLLAPAHVQRALGAHADAVSAGHQEAATDGSNGTSTASTGASLSVCVPVALKERLGVSVDTTVDGLAPTGLNVVDTGPDSMYTTYDARLAVNVNRREDAAVANALHGAADR